MNPLHDIAAGETDLVAGDSALGVRPGGRAERRRFISPRDGRPRLRARRPAQRALDALGLVAGLGLGVTIALGINAETWSALSAPGAG